MLLRKAPCREEKVDVTLHEMRCGKIMLRARVGIQYEHLFILGVDIEGGGNNDGESGR